MQAKLCGYRTDEMPGGEAEHPGAVAFALTAGFSAEVSPSGSAASEALPSAASWLSSPFAEVFGAPGQGDETLAEALAAELSDEGFEEVLAQLVDEAAARHLTSAASWSSESETSSLALADTEVEAWFASLASEADKLLAHLEQEYEHRPVATEDEVGVTAAEYLAENPLGGASEQFIGAIVRKARKLVRGVANVVGKGIAAVGKLLPVGQLFGLLRRLVKPLLIRVLKVAINRLPVELRGPASDLAKRLLGAAEAESATAAQVTAAEFDARLAEAVTSGSDAAAEHIVQLAESEAEAVGEADAATAALDAARTRLAEQLAESTPGVPPVAEVQQFIPAVMAVLPLVRMGIRAVGRDRVVAFLGDRLAEFIRGHVGPDAARSLGRPLADVGLRILSLEAEAPSERGTEAIVATLEDTIREVMTLSEEGFAEPLLHLEAEVQEAFTEAAVRHIPRELLRHDLPGFESADERGVWVFMPRASRRRFRYKKYSSVFPVSISRPLARSVMLSDGGNLERRLLDAGVAGWPVVGEVHLYEAVPGTHLGHVAVSEVPGASESEMSLAVEELDELTPEIANLLTGQPGLGRRSDGLGRNWRQMQPGTRVFRLAVPGARVRRKPRFIVRLNAAGPRPQLRIHLRLSEREAHRVAQMIGQRGLVRVVAMFREILGEAARRSLAARLTRHSARALGTPLPQARSEALATEVARAMVTAVAKELPSAATVLAQAAAAPALGVTLTFTFDFADRAALTSGSSATPTLAIRPGIHRD